MNGRLLMDGFRSLQLVLEKKQPVFTKEMLDIEGEEFLHKENMFGSAVTSSSYDAITPRSLIRLHENNKELRQSEEMLRQARILTKLGNKEGNIKRHDTTVPKVSIKKEQEDHSSSKKNEEIVSPHETIMSYKEKIKEDISSSFQMRKQSRKEEVLSLFVRGVDVSIKDISARIRGCSEKTIQRELNTLLFEDRIERIGEKRWSRYVLK